MTRAQRRPTTDQQRRYKQQSSGMVSTPQEYCLFMSTNVVIGELVDSNRWFGPIGLG